MNSKIQRKLQDDYSYEIDGTMFMSLAKMNRTYSDEILFQLDKYEHSLPVDDHLVQVLSGVVIHEEPLFFRNFLCQAFRCFDLVFDNERNFLP